jgi:hypothetical protein
VDGIEQERVVVGTDEEVNLTHAPSTQGRNDLISPESRPRLKRHDLQALYTSKQTFKGAFALQVKTANCCGFT